MSPLTPEQHAMRNGPDGFVGASEIAAVCGVSRWAAPIDVWLEKTGRADPDPDNPRANIGHRAENVIAQWYCEDEGINPDLLTASPSMRHPNIPFIGATPDRLRYVATDDPHLLCVVQIKCVGANAARFWPVDDELSPDVRCQVEQEMAVVDVDRADVAAWIGGTDFRIIHVERDPELWEMLADGARSFWQHVLDDEPPEIDESETWERYLLDRFPPPDDKHVVPAPLHANRWAREILRLDPEIAALGKARARAANELKNIIKHQYGLQGDGWRAIWHSNGKGGRTLKVKETGQ